MAIVCLNMIVKNESAIIERCLAAAAPHVDCYVICDTGSTDGTPERIRAIMARQGVPGELHTISFETFSQARNEALDRAFASSMVFEYLLLLDADMELIVDEPAYRATLGAPLYLVRQDSSLSYYNVRMIRRDIPARYVGATHEFLSAEGERRRLETVRFVDHANGANRADKFERDIRLLTADLEGDPDNPRSIFYLAQSYRDAGQPLSALQLYERRIELGGWDEEVWFARYMVATCHHRLGDTAQFIKASFEAYNTRPTRAEPLFHLAQHYREVGQHDTCLALCELGKTIPYPSDTLFVERDVYHGGFERELSISGFYSALPTRRGAGREACYRLATDRRATPHWRWRATCNAAFYLRNAEEVFGNVRFLRIDAPAPDGYTATNPSIAVRNGQRFCVIRAVNYRLDGYWTADDGSRTFMTRNAIAEMDRSYRITRCTPVDERADPGPVYQTGIVGFEDCRLFWWQGIPWLSSTSRERNPGGLCEMVLLELSDDWAVRSVHVQSGPTGGDEHRHQKNWMPCVHGDDLLFVQRMEPVTTFRVDPRSRQAVQIASVEAGPALGLTRGGSQLIPFDDGWLAVVHDVGKPGEKRVYMHRFVLIDHELRFAAITEPFRFMRNDVEFCAGLARDPDTGELVASFGVNDAEAWLGFFDEADIRRALRFGNEG